MNDWELIQNYCRNGSEGAFETLVKRHVDYVYCAAMRQVRDSSLAEDVSQAVFLLLAQKAKTFRPDTILLSWLFRTTHHMAAHALRSEYRRQRRETEAAKMNPTTTTPDIDHQWERISPMLDEALAALPHKDRDAVLLRFIARKSFSQVGADLGASEQAAKKRVSRALVRLRDFFTQRGTTLSVLVIAVLLGERVVQASPALLATQISAVVGSGAAASASGPAAALLKITLRELFWTKVKWGAAISAVVVMALLAVTTVLRPVHNQTAISVASAPPAQTQTSLDSKPEIPADSTVNESTTNHILSLTVLSTEDRRPISGARVLVDARSNEKKRVLEASTDASGTLQIPIPPQTDFKTLRVWVSTEGRIPMVMDWQSHEFTEPILSHTVLLDPAKTMSGTVLNEAGNPVAGAKIWYDGLGIDSAKRDNRGSNPELSFVYTDANGRWTSTQIPPSGIGIRVSSPDYLPIMYWFGGATDFPTNAILVLRKGVSLVGRVTTTNGTPVPNASVSEHNAPDWSTRTMTDANGYFSWPQVAPGQVFIDVNSEGFETAHEFAWATNAANECALTLTPSSNPAPATAASEDPLLRLHGNVVDAETGEPIPSFRVLTGDVFTSPTFPGDVVLINLRLLGEGRDGQFDWPNLPRGRGFRLQVEAEGYLESISDERPANDSGREYNFKLHHAAMLAGQVLNPDGSAVEGATVTLTGAGMGPVMARPGEIFPPNLGFIVAKTRTDHEGKFSLKPKTGAHGIAVIHESGSALLTFADATNGPILLKPWGAIDGTLYLNRQPAPNQTVVVNGSQKLDVDPKVMFTFSYTTNTDERGHFHFDKVPPGEQTVSRKIGPAGGGLGVAVNFDLAAKVKVEHGTTTSVELRRQGRPVIGHIAIQGAAEEVRWESSQAFLQGKDKIPLALSEDGSIRADDVPPGTYTLSVDLQASTPEPFLEPKTFGSLQKQITISSAEQESVPVDLGELTVTQAK
jgi:RNA polymerase sigma factor (sigma-70 family)